LHSKSVIGRANWASFRKATAIFKNNIVDLCKLKKKQIKTKSKKADEIKGDRSDKYKGQKISLYDGTILGKNGEILSALEI
jgi:uncharacterized protein YrrD